MSDVTVGVPVGDLPGTAVGAAQPVRITVAGLGIDSDGPYVSTGARPPADEAAWLVMDPVDGSLSAIRRSV